MTLNELNNLSGPDLARECRMAIRRLRLFPADPEAQKEFDDVLRSCDASESRRGVWRLAILQIEQEKQTGCGVE